MLTISISTMSNKRLNRLILLFIEGEMLNEINYDLHFFLSFPFHFNFHSKSIIIFKIKLYQGKIKKLRNILDQSIFSFE